MLEFFSASTGVVDTKRAITECLDNAFSGESSHDCDLLIIYTAMGHNFKELIFEAHRLCPSSEVVGCTCSGVIGKEGSNETIKALAIMAVRGPRNLFAVAGEGNLLGADLSETARHLALELKKQCPTTNMVFIHPSFNLNNSDKYFIENLETVFGFNIPVIGGVSLDNMKFITSFQFIGNEIFENGVVMIGLGDPDLEVICGANHGFEIIGDPFLVTKTENNIINEFDGKKAWKRWTERLGLSENSSASDVLTFSPLADPLPEEFHEEFESGYRLFGSMPLPDKSVKSITEPLGERIWLAKRNEAHIHDGVERLMIKILDKCAGRKPVAVFHADCAARGKLLFNRVMKEELINQIQNPLCKGESIPWFGMYAGSEYTPVCGKNMLHGYTTSLYVIVQKKSTISRDLESKDKFISSSIVFTESQINNLKLRSRLIRSATWQGMANNDGTCSPSNISVLLPLARSAVGLIISEMMHVSTDGICSPGEIGISSDRHIPGLKRMTDFVHRSGCDIVAQLNHGGLMAIPVLAGITPVGPSPIESSDVNIGREMNITDIESVITEFRDSALRAREAGFNGIQLHSAHCMLLSQFLSPYYNRRTDEYGGSLENRSRLLLSVVKSIRNAVGGDFALLVKINSEDLLPGGFDRDQLIKVAVMLKDAGIDALEISGGTLGALLAGDLKRSFSPTGKDHAYYREAARDLKKKISIPVILVGGIRTFGEAEELIKSKIADYISLSRPLIREPDLISKWKSGNMKKADCISDTACIFEGARGRGVHCIHVHNS
jgi:2,4-dienoyl-CoA reductase-like NADH-dependent reductase (Old Yellow Enzyme family)